MLSGNRARENKLGTGINKKKHRIVAVVLAVMLAVVGTAIYAPQKVVKADGEVDATVTLHAVAADAASIEYRMLSGLAGENPAWQPVGLAGSGEGQFSASVSYTPEVNSYQIEYKVTPKSGYVITESTVPPVECDGYNTYLIYLGAAGTTFDVTVVNPVNVLLGDPATPAGAAPDGLAPDGSTPDGATPDGADPLPPVGDPATGSTITLVGQKADDLTGYLASIEVCSDASFDTDNASIASFAGATANTTERAADPTLDLKYSFAVDAVVYLKVTVATPDTKTAVVKAGGTPLTPTGDVYTLAANADYTIEVVDKAKTSITVKEYTKAYKAEDAGGKIELSVAADGEYKEINAFDGIAVKEDNTAAMALPGNAEELKYAYTTDAKLYLKLTPNEDYTAALYLGSDAVTADANGVYTLEPGSSYSVKFTKKQIEPAYLLEINGREFIFDSARKEYEVPADYDFEKFVVNVKKIGDTEYKDGNFATGKMVVDDKDAFSVSSSTFSDNANKIKLKITFDGTSTANTNGYPSFEIDGIILTRKEVSPKAGATVEKKSLPDIMDANADNNVKLEEHTDRSNPAVITTFYGDSLIQLTTEDGVAIKALNVDGNAKAAVSVDAANGTLKVDCPYYDSFLVQVVLENNKSGWIKIQQVGLQIGQYGPGETAASHGGKSSGAGFPNPDPYKIVGTFYHPASMGSGAYQLIAVLKYANGAVHTTVINAYGSTACAQDANILGSDFLIWSGQTADEMPVNVSAYAIKSGALSGTTYGGTAFGGASTGVTWVR